jgi:hypothetical protein
VPTTITALWAGVSFRWITMDGWMDAASFRRCTVLGKHADCQRGTRWCPSKSEELVRPVTGAGRFCCRRCSHWQWMSLLVCSKVWSGVSVTGHLLVVLGR